MKKAVVITGAGSGIGEATALEFSRHDYFVFLLGRTSLTLEKVAKSLHGNGETIICDVKSISSVQAAALRVLSYPGVQILTLVNNAGTFHLKPFEESSDDLWQDDFNSNLFGSVRITREFFPYFKHQKQGAIVNVSSTLGLSPTAGTAVYSASKAAMVNWTQTLALEGGPFGIRSNCVCPGLVDTPIHAFHSAPTEEKKVALEKMARLQPLQRIGTAAEVAQAIYFLGSESSSWTTGAVLAVDGGINLQ
jgi:NAD(P)-dependent dehydrogenase (short-subunit alcohol dehydrogenase family)